jgi:hypothetical protein
MIFLTVFTWCGHKGDQVIIFENQHPPEFVFKEGTATVFTKSPHHGRYGFFPLN